MEPDLVVIDSEDEVEITSILLVNAQPNHPRHTQEDAASLPARPSYSEGSAKASDNEPKGRRKPNPRRVTTRQFKDHINTDATWLNAATVQCEALCRLLAEQGQHIATLNALDTKQCQIAAKMSADHLPRSTRLQLGRELGKLEERRSKATSELRQATKSASREGATMKQDLELWCVKEKKVTDRIEKSR